MFFRSTIDADGAKAALLSKGDAVMSRLAEYTAERARATCPVDTGELRDSIRVIKTSGSGSYHVVATAAHAQFVEFGHHAGNTWVPPNPFMRRALEDARREFPRIAEAARVRRPSGSGSHFGVTF